MVTVGGIISGGFGLLRSRPLSALTWGIVYVAVSVIGLFAMLAPFMQFMMANAGSQVAPNPAMMFQFVGQIYLFDFALLFLLVVLMTAGLRAALRPEESSFASLRLGMDELRMIGLTLLFVIAAFVLMIVLFILVTIVGGAAGIFSSFGPNSGGQVGLTGLVLLFVLFAVPVFFGVRLSPAFALTVMRRRIVIGEAWRLSSGHFWVMFAGFLVLNLIVLAVYLALLYLAVIPLLAIAIGSNPAAAMELMQGHVGGGVAAAVLIFGLLFAVLSGVSFAFICGGVAAATRSLTGESDTDLAETFA